MPAPSRVPLRWIAASTLLALLAALGTIAVLRGDDGADPVDPAEAASLTLEPETSELGDVASAVFTTFEGDEVGLATLQGSPVVVNFFASTCVPCITEMPALETVHQEVRERVEFLGLAVADRPDDAQRLVEETGVTYTTAQDKDSSVITALGGTMLPTTVLLDADGAIVATHTGKITAEELRGLIAEHFGITSP